MAGTFAGTFFNMSATNGSPGAFVVSDALGSQSLALGVVGGVAINPATGRPWPIGLAVDSGWFHVTAAVSGTPVVEGVPVAAAGVDPLVMSVRAPSP